MLDKNNTTKSTRASSIPKKNHQLKPQKPDLIGRITDELHKLKVFFIFTVILSIPIMIVLNAFLGETHNWVVYLSSSIVSVMIAGVVCKLLEK